MKFRQLHTKDINYIHNICITDVCYNNLETYEIAPTQQNPDYSYATRSSSTDYYSFKF